MLPRPSGIVALLTDFGARDPYVGLMKGMVLRAAKNAVLVDICHEVPPQDTAVGAFWLRAAIGRFPPGTVFAAVVDPGVGSARRLLCAAAHECYWLAPDNGLLGEVLAAAAGAGAGSAAEVRAVALDHLGLAATSRTFHGRDLFAPIAGSLASGRYGFTALGPRAGEVARLESVLAGGPRVVHVDGYGNLITNVGADALGAAAAVRVAGRAIPVRRTYAEAAPGELLALVNSYDLLEIAENLGSAATALGVGCGEPVSVEA